MPSKTITVLALLISALALSGCAKSYKVEPALQVRPQVSEAPRFANPPSELIERPAIIDFLPPSERLPPQAFSDARPKSSSSETSSPPGRPFSSTR